MTQSTKRKIENVVKEYVKVFPIEFDAFKQSKEGKSHLLINPLGTTATDGIIKQHVSDMPETLFTMLKLRLTDEEWKDYDTEKSTLWFARKYKDFAIAQKI